MSRRSDKDVRANHLRGRAADLLGQLRRSRDHVERGVIYGRYQKAQMALAGMDQLPQ